MPPHSKRRRTVCEPAEDKERDGEQRGARATITCPVCLDDVATESKNWTAFQCSHAVCTSCYASMRSRRMHLQCPLCRHEEPGYVPARPARRGERHVMIEFVTSPSMPAAEAQRIADAMALDPRTMQSLHALSGAWLALEEGEENAESLWESAQDAVQRALGPFAPTRRPEQTPASQRSSFFWGT